MTLKEAKHRLLRISADQGIDRRTAAVQMVHILYEVREDIRRVFGNGHSDEDFEDCFQEAVMMAYTTYNPQHDSEKTFFGYFELLLQRLLNKRAIANGRDARCAEVLTEDEDQPSLSERLPDPTTQQAFDQLENREEASEQLLRLSALILQLHDTIQKKTDRISWQYYRLFFSNELIDTLRKRRGELSFFEQHERDFLQTMDVALVAYTYVCAEETIHRLSVGELKTYRAILGDHPRGDDTLDTPFISKILQAYWFDCSGETRTEAALSKRRAEFADFAKKIL